MDQDDHKEVKPTLLKIRQEINLFKNKYLINRVFGKIIDVIPTGGYAWDWKYNGEK